jgi:predicted transcriptional regulator
MLGIRLDAVSEERLARHARETGRPKSVIARDWIVERLNREDVDGLIRRASELDAEKHRRVFEQAQHDATDAWLQALDAEDGGYDWGPGGPPLATR